MVFFVRNIFEIITYPFASYFSHVNNYYKLFIYFFVLSTYGVLKWMAYSNSAHTVSISEEVKYNKTLAL